MDLRTAKKLLVLRNASIPRGQKAEAYVTAWITALLAEAGLLFHKFRPQALCVGRGGVGAGEYDFVRLDENGVGVVLELKPAHFGRNDLERALIEQAVPYAHADRRFTKGLAIVSNGFEFVWSAVHCPTRAGARPVNCAQAHETLDSAEALAAFVRRFLSPTPAFVDSTIAEGYRADALLKNLQTSSAGSHTGLWKDVQDAVRNSNGWTSRKQEATVAALRTLALDLRRYSQFREATIANAVYRVLRQPDHQTRLIKNIVSQHGASFPAEAALRNALGDFRQRLPSC